MAASTELKDRIGQYFWGIRVLRGKTQHTLRVFADEIRIQDGDLLLFGHMKGGEPASFLYRAFSRGTWSDVFAASCLDGTECGEEYDVDESTCQNARYMET